MENIEFDLLGDSVIKRNGKDSYFKAKFGGGFYIKGLISHLSSVKTQATFIFTEDSIQLTTSLLDNQAVKHLHLDASMFPYEFKGKNPILMTISLKDFNNALSAISKSSGLILEKEEGKDILHVTPTDSSTGTPMSSKSSIKFTREEIDEVLVDLEYDRSPSCYIKTNVFSQMFNSFIKNKITRVECYGSKSGIKFIGVNTLATSTLEHTFGQFDSNDEDIDNMLAIRPDVIKTLTKLAPLNNGGEIRVFYRNENPHKFVVPIGFYGVMDIFIYDMRSEEEINEEIKLAKL